jgi:hypothetical protein
MIARLTVLIGFGLLAFSTDAGARGWDEKLDGRAWACSGPYSPSPLNVVSGKEWATGICVGESKRKPMARAQAYEQCRKQFSATSLLLNWTSKGWLCRYYGR